MRWVSGYRALIWQQGGRWIAYVVPPGGRAGDIGDLFHPKGAGF